MNILSSMTYDEKLKWFASADRVTIGTITQVFEKDLKRFYVAKIRGIIVSDGENYRHTTKKAARAFGQKILEGWKELYANRLKGSEE